MAFDLENYLEPATFDFKLLQVGEVYKLQKTVTLLLFSKSLTREELAALEEIYNGIDQLAIKIKDSSSVNRVLFYMPENKILPESH